MADESTVQKVDRSLVVTIVRSYVAKNSIAADQLGGLITTVHRTLSGLGTNAPPAEALTRRLSLSGDRCSRTMSSAWNVDFAAKLCAATCGFGTASRSPLIGRAGNCRRIIR